MSVTRRAPLVAAAVAASVLSVFTLAACTGTPDPSTTPSTTRTSSTDPATSAATTTTTTPSTTTKPDAAALRSAEASVPAFWTVLDSLSAEPKSDLAALAAVARDPAFQTWQQLIVQRRVKGLRQVGATKVTKAVAMRTGALMFDVQACIDVSGTDLVDNRGRSVVPSDRSPRVRYQYTVVQGSDSKFYVTQDKAAGSC